MSYVEIGIIICFIAFLIVLFLGVSWVVVEGISSTKIKDSNIKFLSRIRIKLNNKLTDPRTRYIWLLFFFTPWWILSECFSVIINLGFTGFLDNDTYRTASIIMIVIAKSIAQILSFLVAALLVKLFIDKVDRTDQ